MKMIPALSLGLFALLAGPTLADTTTSASTVGDCPLVGAAGTESKECADLRVAFRTEVGDCMDKMLAETDARAGKAVSNTAHAYRARFINCDAATRAKMGLKAN